MSERPTRYQKYRNKKCWAIMTDGTQCTGIRRSSKPWTGPGSRDGLIALCNGHNTHFIKYGEPRTDIPLHAMMPMTFEERVEHYMNPVNGYIRISPYGCFLWQRTKLQKGYGLVNSKVIAARCGTKNNVQTHRMMWIYANGDIPEGKQVHHSCGNPSCCNPNCLYLLTGPENSEEASRYHYWKNKYQELEREMVDKNKQIKSLERRLAKEKNKDKQRGTGGLAKKSNEQK